MLRCPFAIWHPGPAWKTSGALGATGVTLHSAEYDLDPDDKILYNALHSDREASWHFTITKPPFAFIFQHYEINLRTWHCGPGNPYTIGIELEGVAPAKCEGPQYDLLVRLLKWLPDALNWAPLWRRGSLDTKNVVGGIFEHRQWMLTNCAVFSNKQVDPVRLIADLKEKDMDEARLNEILKAHEEADKLEWAARGAVASKVHNAQLSALTGHWENLAHDLEAAVEEAKRWNRWEDE